MTLGVFVSVSSCLLGWSSCLFTVCIWMHLSSILQWSAVQCLCYSHVCMYACTIFRKKIWHHVGNLYVISSTWSVSMADLSASHTWHTVTNILSALVLAQCFSWSPCFCAGDGERWEGASVTVVHEGSGQQRERGCCVPADGLSPSVLGELPAHTALHPAHGRSPAAAVQTLHRHHGQWAGCYRWLAYTISLCVINVV